MSKPHAVTSAGTSAFCYDQNGNMVRRTIGANVYNLAYDSENRLVSVSGAATATFIYDGDGRRVKGTINWVTTTYIGEAFEWSGSTSTMKKYYAAGGTRLAVRTGETLNWLLGDHLGSTNITADSSAIQVGKLLYKPLGEERFSSGTTPTTFKFTGQRQESSFGLYLYGSRWYDTSLGRFISSDPIIPEAYNPLAYDRYQYVYSNPLRYTDPSGNCPVCLIIGIGVALVVWLANPEPAYAPEPGFVPPTDVDPDYGDKAYFDTAPGTGDISDIYAAVIGRTLFTGEELDTGSRIIAGAASVAPVVTAGGLRQVWKLFDIARYGDNVAGFVKHHGVLDIWASANIPGYIRRNPNAPTILLTSGQHAKTIEIFNQWRLERTGSITGAIDWTLVSPQEVQTLAEKMFNAAGVPKEARQYYYRAINRYIYEELP